MSSFTIDKVNMEKNHVTFTITYDDKTTHTDTRCDLPMQGDDLIDALMLYTREMSLGHDQEISNNSKNNAHKLVGKTVTV